MAESRVVFVPLGLAQWRRLADTGDLAGPFDAYGVTPGLLAWGEFGPDDHEDAGFAAQSVAAVAALTLPDESGPRIVVAHDGADFIAAPDSVMGQGHVPALRITEVTAVFTDPPDVDLAAARAAARGRTAAEAWDDPSVAAASENDDLGWYGLDEARAW